MSGLIDPDYGTNQLDDLVDFYCSTTILVKDVKNPAEINHFYKKNELLLWHKDATVT